MTVTGCGGTTTTRSTDLAGRAATGSEAYICTYGYDDQPGTTVTAVDLGSRRVDRSVATGSLPSAVTATPDGRRLLVTDQGDDHLVVLDTATDAVIARIATGVEPDAVAVSPDGTIAVVADIDDNTVIPVDLTTLRAGHPIDVGARPDAVAIGGPGGRTALVADFGGDTITPIDLSTMRPGAPIATGAEPDAVVMTPGGTTALVADFGGDTITPIDLSTLHPRRAVTVGPGPTALAVSATGPGGAPTAWVTAGTDLVPLNLTSFTTGPPINIGHLAEAVAIGGDGVSAWVAGQDATLTPVDLATGAVRTSVVVGGRPEAIAIPSPRR